jgi:serine phosphatase RsbU (regulator of sigma subunit)
MEESEGWVKLPADRMPGRECPQYKTDPLPAAQTCHGPDVLNHLSPGRERTVNKQIPSYLKLVTDTTAETPAVASEDLAAIAEVAGAFESAIGWRLEIDGGPVKAGNPNLMWSAPVNPGVGIAPGHIRLLSPSADSKREKPRVPLDRAGLLAAAVGNLWGELVSTRHALWQREAELAAGVPLVVRDEDAGPSLGERLEAVLRGGGEAIGCDAVALYLLDPATTELKLRSSWGLPRKRLTAPARQLRGAVADLEALLGHAVVLTDPGMFDYWKVPEAGFGAYVCVPVSSPSMPLGTLWAFSRAKRDFNDAQTNILEVVAGRVASDLEREVLVDEAVQAREQSRQVTAAERSQRGRLPTIAPVIDGWEVAAATHHVGPVGGTFYDWFELEDGSLSVLAGDALAPGVEGALTSAALRATGRAMAPQRVAVERLLEKANSVLWTGSAGNECGGLFQAILEPKASVCTFAASGPLRVLAIAGDEEAALAGPTTPLGWREDLRVEPVRHEMSKGDLLVVYGTGYLAQCDELTLSTLDAQLATRLAAAPKLSAARLAELALETLAAQRGVDTADRLLLVIKKRAR